MASHNMLVAPNDDSVSTVWALVTTYAQWFGQDILKSDGNSAKGFCSYFCDYLVAAAVAEYMEKVN